MSSNTMRPSVCLSRGDSATIYSIDEADDITSDSVDEFRSSIILFVDGKDDHKEVMTYYTAIPQKDEEEARPYKSLYCVLHAVLENTIPSVPGITPIRNDDANFKLVSNHLKKLNQDNLADEERLTAREVNTVSRKWLAIGVAEPKSLDEMESPWDGKIFVSFCKLWRRGRERRAKLKESEADYRKIFQRPSLSDMSL